MLEIENRLQAQMERALLQTRHRLERIAMQLDSGSPLKKLGKGYSLVKHESGATVNDFHDVRVGEQLTLHMLGGDVFARVEEKKERANTWEQNR